MTACTQSGRGPAMSQSTSILLYLIGLVSGSFGGAGAAGWHVLGGRRFNRAMLIAYVVVGAVVGLFVDIWMLIWAISNGLNVNNMVHHLFVLGIGAGFIVTSTLLLLQKVAAVALKWRGVQVQVSFRQEKSATQSEEDSA